MSVFESVVGICTCRQSHTSLRMRSSMISRRERKLTSVGIDDSVRQYRSAELYIHNNTLRTVQRVLPAYWPYLLLEAWCPLLRPAIGRAASLDLQDRFEKQTCRRIKEDQALGCDKAAKVIRCRGRSFDRCECRYWTERKITGTRRAGFLRSRDKLRFPVPDSFRWTLVD